MILRALDLLTYLFAHVEKNIKALMNVYNLCVI